MGLIGVTGTVSLHICAILSYDERAVSTRRVLLLQDGQLLLRYHRSRPLTCTVCLVRLREWPAGSGRVNGPVWSQTCLLLSPAPGRVRK